MFFQVPNFLLCEYIFFLVLITVTLVKSDPCDPGTPPDISWQSQKNLNNFGEGPLCLIISY